MGTEYTAGGSESLAEWLLGTRYSTSSTDTYGYIFMGTEYTASGSESLAEMFTGNHIFYMLNWYLRIYLYGDWVYCEWLGKFGRNVYWEPYILHAQLIFTDISLWELSILRVAQKVWRIWLIGTWDSTSSTDTYGYIFMGTEYTASGSESLTEMITGNQIFYTLNWYLRIYLYGDWVYCEWLGKSGGNDYWEPERSAGKQQLKIHEWLSLWVT